MQSINNSFYVDDAKLQNTDPFTLQYNLNIMIVLFEEFGLNRNMLAF